MQELKNDIVRKKQEKELWDLYNKTLKNLIEDKNKEIQRLEGSLKEAEHNLKQERRRRKSKSSKCDTLNEQMSMYSDFISTLLNDYDLPEDLVSYIEDIQI